MNHIVGGNFVFGTDLYSWNKDKSVPLNPAVPGSYSTNSGMLCLCSMHHAPSLLLQKQSDVLPSVCMQTYLLCCENQVQDFFVMNGLCVFRNLSLLAKDSN